MFYNVFIELIVDENVVIDFICEVVFENVYDIVIENIIELLFNDDYDILFLYFRSMMDCFVDI